MKNVSLIPILLSAAALTGACFGQELGVSPFGGVVRADPVGFPARSYQSRAVDVVYDCLTNVFTNGSHTHLGTCSQILEDISFVPGPWAIPAGDGPPHVITEITYGLLIDNIPTSTEQVLFIFWDKDDINFQGWAGPGTNMINPAATPRSVFRFDVGPQNPGFYYQFTASLTGLPGGGVTVPATDDGVALQVAWINNARF